MEIDVFGFKHLSPAEIDFDDPLSEENGFRFSATVDRRTGQTVPTPRTLTAENNGQIVADGGSVLITTAAATDVTANALRCCEMIPKIWSNMPP